MSDELLGIRYSIPKDVGEGTVSRIIIDEGLEIAHWDSSTNMKWSYDNEKNGSNIIEISYCYKGSAEIQSLPNKRKYFFEKGDIAFYRMNNNIDGFNFHYKGFKAISIHMNLDSVKSFINPIWEEKIVAQWQNSIDNIFSNNVLSIEKVPYNIKVIAEEIKDIDIRNMMDYMNVKSKVIEFLILCLHFKSNKKHSLSNFTKEEVDIIYKAENILLQNIQNPLSVDELAQRLNITVYKLQKGFKKIFGNTVYEYTKRLRIEKSKTLLKNIDIPIIEIANEVGYENPSKFSSVFKSYMKMTPSEYRFKYR